LYGDGGTDVTIHRDHTWQIDVKTNRYDWSDNVEPVLKIDREKHDKNDHLDAYYLMEQITEKKYRAIGYIPYSQVKPVGTKIDEGETYKPEGPRYSVPSHKNNRFIEANDLTAVFLIPE
jgi:hypothetical protein